MAAPIPRPGGLHLGPDFGTLGHSRPGRPRTAPTPVSPPPGVGPPGLPRLAKIADSAPNYNSVMQPPIKHCETVQPHQAPMPPMDDQSSSNALAMLASNSGIVGFRSVFGQPSP